VLVQKTTIEKVSLWVSKIFTSERQLLLLAVLLALELRFLAGSLNMVAM